MAEAEPRTDTLRSRLAEVRRRIESSALRAGRRPEEVTLVAVSKTHATPVLREALAAGVSVFGENRVQEAEGKIEELGRDAVSWHLIGHLQSNKARRAVRLFDCVHSLDSVEMVNRLDGLCVEEGRESLDVLVQVDLAGEETKSGAREDELPPMIEALAGCERLKFRGLMLLPPYFEDAELVRPFFRRLRGLRDELRQRGAFGEGAGELSMGMTHDFELAVEEGATMVRVGTAIFGARATRGAA